MLTLILEDGTLCSFPSKKVNEHLAELYQYQYYNKEENDIDNIIERRNI